MGTWGVGLYSSDFARDLRSAIAAVARLPFSDERLAEILVGTESSAANDPANEDHTIFWLVLADQFARRSITSVRASDCALRIIDEGSDLAMLERLGMKPADLGKRRKFLTELRSRIASPSSAEKPRRVLKKPQPYVMDVGEIFTYPTSGGDNINPYFVSKDLMRNWSHDGWGALVIVECGRVFEFLAWYRPLTVRSARPEKPSIDQLHAESPWLLRRPGTCSAAHFKRMEFEKIGSVNIAAERLAAAFPSMPSAQNATISDISIANSMHLGPNLMDRAIQFPGQPLARHLIPTISKIDEILVR
jgi:hypothetical protein